MLVTKVPQIDLGDENKKIFLEPCNAHFTKVLPTTTPGSTNFTALSFVCPAPSRTTFTDRRIRFIGSLRVTIADPTGVTPILVAGQVAPRAYPFASMIQSVNINIDNQSFTFLPSKIMPALTHFFRRKMDTLAPTYLDKYQNYGDCVLANNNPLSSYFNSDDHNQRRGASSWYITSNTNTSASFVIEIFEQLFIPPFTHHEHQDMGLSNYSNMDIQFIFTSKPSRVISFERPLGSNFDYDSGSIVLEWITNPTLYIDYYTNSAEYVPRPLLYKCDQYILQTTAIGSLAPLTSNKSSSNSYQFSVIPNKVYIWVQKADTTKNCNDTDTFLRIEGVNLTFGNMTGILSSADTHTLFMMSKKNGLVDSFNEWFGELPNLFTPPFTPVGGVGSVLCLEFGSDIPMTQGFYPGQPGSFNFQVTELTYSNINQSNTLNNLQMYVLLQIDSYGFFGDTVVREMGITQFPKEQSQMEPVPYSQIKSYYGAGNMFQSAAKLLPYIQKGNQMLKDYRVISNVARMVPHPAAQTVGHIARHLGYGDNPALNEAVAGRILTNHELTQRVKRYH